MKIVSKNLLIFTKKLFKKRTKTRPAFEHRCCIDFGANLALLCFPKPTKICPKINPNMQQNFDRFLDALGSHLEAKKTPRRPQEPAKMAPRDLHKTGSPPPLSVLATKTSPKTPARTSQDRSLIPQNRFLIDFDANLAPFSALAWMGCPMQFREALGSHEALGCQEALGSHEAQDA